MKMDDNALKELVERIRERIDCNGLSVFRSETLAALRQVRDTERSARQEADDDWIGALIDAVPELHPDHPNYVEAKFDSKTTFAERWALIVKSKIDAAAKDTERLGALENFIRQNDGELSIGFASRDFLIRELGGKIVGHGKSIRVAIDAMSAEKETGNE